jgi:hypothetical protein
MGSMRGGSRGLLGRCEWEREREREKRYDNVLKVNYF